MALRFMLGSASRLHFATAAVKPASLLAPHRVGLLAGTRAFGEKRGTVKWFNSEKGFGFISTEEGDVFVHHTNIEGTGFRSLADGEEVEFDLQVDESRGKTSAVRVTGPGGAAVQGSARPPPGDFGGGGGDRGGFGGDRGGW
eukprot:TRINITY_DN1743_c0_g1_i1.p1 TRINITY_DN1743_c0_g1~~TRINITY_DN1743_c0_g1_i1.p1  ORF type:complete len:142 (-),score=32.80 TRINITY_DN1743_c0_g1_i1:163-588(-)